MVPPYQDIERLRSIKRVDQLVQYLRDELNWPITDASDFINIDNLFFEWDAKELGIDLVNAAKIQEIRQLRPLVPGQPWGIFFVKFEPKKLPVVALRRILSKLVIKKRAQRGDQAAWKNHDLLFISNYGEGADRQITFAQFSQPTDRDLPTLKVLGWDESDTDLHIDYTHHTLKDKLTWCNEYKNDFKIWREAWSGAFVLRNREVIETSQELAIELADLAKRIRNRALKVLQIEKEDGVLRQLHAAFKKNLIHDLDDKGFSDMYAQTISYGLLAARMSRVGNLVSDHISDMVPATNPFLKELLETFLKVGGRQDKIDFDELGIQDVVELLNRPETKIEAILRDFGNGARREDPVVYFYESFLNEYDADLKIRRGVFYTPQPVVSYIVRSVHELLQTEFGLEDGLASTITWGEMEKRQPGFKIPDGVSKDSMFVQILDPATGTGTFLVEVIDVIYKHLMKKWVDAGCSEQNRLNLWNDYVPRYLLPRLYGYELMMAPYAIAHMRVCLKFSEINICLGQPNCESTFKSCVHIYLTNALEQHCDLNPTEHEGILPALSHEMQAVSRIKRDNRFTVIIGNPPYSVSSSNKGDWIKSLVADYKTDLLERNIQPLSDDYIKFIRLGQYYISRNGVGILAYISNNSFIDGLIHWQMRKQLLSTFDNIYVLDLHGNSHRREVADDGSPDKNVFAIMQGVSINMFVKSDSKTGKVFHFDLRGNKETKYDYLVAHTLPVVQWKELDCNAPKYCFTNTQTELSGSCYEKWIGLAELFPINITGIKTHDDGNLVSFKPFAENNFYYDYRPFDTRFINYDLNKVVRHRFSVMRHMLHKNVSLIIPRQAVTSAWTHVQISKNLSDNRIQHSNKGIPIICPLYLYDDEKSKRTPNLNPKIVEKLANSLHIVFENEKEAVRTASMTVFTPRDILDYVYAILHSPTYRHKYQEHLITDFPRVPIPGIQLFFSMAKLGSELISLHLIESSKSTGQITKWKGNVPSSCIDKVTYENDTIFINKSKSQGFYGVPRDVWDLHVGGYPVCSNWLKARKGLSLSSADIEYYHKLVVILNETIRIMTKIDEVINQYGGWPSAFQKEE